MKIISINQIVSGHSTVKAISPVGAYSMIINLLSTSDTGMTIGTGISLR